MTDLSKLLFICNEIFGFLSSTENAHTQTLYITVLGTDLEVCKNATTKKDLKVQDYLISYKYEYRGKAEVRLSRDDEVFYEKKEKSDINISISI